MSEEGNSIDDFLNDEPKETPVTPAIEPEPEAGQPRGPDGKFASKEPETGVEPQETAETVPPTDKLPQEEYKAIREEREKRQALEREVEALKQQFQQQPKEPPAPPPSMWEDEQGWQQHFGNQVAQQAALNAKLDLSEMLARRDNADFEDMKARFVQMAEANPAIVQQALADADPWGKAYKIAKNAATMDELGATDLETLETKLREKIMAELQAGSEPVPPPPVVPPTLTTERNVGARTGPAWSGPLSLEEMLR